MSCLAIKTFWDVAVCKPIRKLPSTQFLFIHFASRPVIQPSFLGSRLDFAKYTQIRPSSLNTLIDLAKPWVNWPSSLTFFICAADASSLCHHPTDLSVPWQDFSLDFAESLKQASDDGRISISFAKSRIQKANDG